MAETADPSNKEHSGKNTGGRISMKRKAGLSAGKKEEQKFEERKRAKIGFVKKEKTAKTSESLVERTAGAGRTLDSPIGGAKKIRKAQALEKKAANGRKATGGVKEPSSRSAPKQEDRISPRVLRLARKKLAASSPKTARAEKKKLKKTKNLKEALQPVLAKLQEDKKVSDKVLAAVLAEPQGSVPGTEKGLRVQNKLAKGREVPIGEDAAVQAHWFWKAYTDHFGSTVSALEGEGLTEENLLALPRGPREGEGALPSLVAHAQAAVEPLWEAQGRGEGGGGREPGSPALLLVCPSAQRCTQVLRDLKELGRRHGFAKLFAKHMKVEEQMEFLKKPVFVAAGTPARIERLAGLGALGLGSLQLLVLDLFKTPKGLTVLDIPETRVDFWELYQKHLHGLVMSKQTQICLI